MGRVVREEDSFVRRSSLFVLGASSHSDWQEGHSGYSVLLCLLAVWFVRLWWPIAPDESGSEVSVVLLRVSFP